MNCHTKFICLFVKVNRNWIPNQIGTRNLCLTFLFFCNEHLYRLIKVNRNWIPSQIGTRNLVWPFSLFCNEHLYRLIFDSDLPLFNSHIKLFTPRLNIFKETSLFWIINLAGLRKQSDQFDGDVSAFSLVEGEACSFAM